MDITFFNESNLVCESNTHFQLHFVVVGALPHQEYIMHVENAISINEYFIYPRIYLPNLSLISDKEHKYSNHSLGKNMMLCMPAELLPVFTRRHLNSNYKAIDLPDILLS